MERGARTISDNNAVGHSPSRHGAVRDAHDAGSGSALTDRDALADVGTAVRRALAARTSDPHLIDDLTQETLLRLARSEQQLTADEQRAYAVVTARNLLTSHFRRQSVQRRHEHLLVEPDGATDPEQRTIDNEESAALASALTRDDPGERDLLFRHEVAGTDLATLAGEADVSSGAIAMRLARARANLRLEFLLVFRRLALPTPQCRPVLLALAAGDRRRQAQLDAVGHVVTCPTCEELIGPMTERDRRVAAGFLAPLADLWRRLRRAFRSWWVRVATAGMLVATAGGLIVLADDPSGADDASSGPRSPPRTVPAATAPNPTTPTSARAGTVAPPPPPPPVAPTTAAAPAVASSSPGPSPPPAAPVPPSTAAVPDTQPTCPPAVPLTDVELPAAVGCPFAVTVVTVVAIPSGTEVAATAGAMSVAIRLEGGTLPLTVTPGVQIAIAGTIEEARSPSQLAVTVGAGDVRLAG
jgi:RNA polymerase sigma factor (sigma-70 family)